MTGENRLFSSDFYSNQKYLRYQEKRQKQKSRKSESSLRELSKILAKTGAVTGKGETIEKANKRVEMVDSVTQVEAVNIEFEISKGRMGELTRYGERGREW